MTQSRRTNWSLPFVYLALFFFAAITLLPFFWLVTSSLKTGSDFFTSRFLPPGDGWFGIAWDRLTLDNFRRLFLELEMPRAIVNSLFYASVTSLAATLAAAMCGYALARFRFAGERVVLGAVIAAIIIPGPLLLAPTYRLLWQLGLLDSYAGLILPGMAPAFGVFLLRQAMLHGVPAELLEAARIDGGGEWRIFFTIVLPLVRPMLGAFILITFLAAWNNFVGPQVVMQSPEQFPLSVALNNLKGIYGTDFGLITAGTLISISPVMCLFLLMQREFISGLTSGAVKG